MKLFLAFALIVAACYTCDITQFHRASIPKCFMHLVDSGTSKSRLACLQMCRSRCIFVEFDANSGLCNRYQYGNTSHCAAGNSNFVSVYKKVIISKFVGTF
ncbi:hypothetical protein DPMN_032870 [Dreissena polymorpha]|uniref:Apple domain-containing protein n=1 Tax=Dreissena polymorpha TaxID=45954 RepID=A0A9D4RKN6_DREPO|nr:hypothetical protein DPMN_032870 [Dreissena polymorpha]